MSIFAYVFSAVAHVLSFLLLLPSSSFIWSVGINFLLQYIVYFSKLYQHRGTNILLKAMTTDWMLIGIKRYKIYNFFWFARERCNKIFAAFSWIVYYIMCKDALLQYTLIYAKCLSWCIYTEILIASTEHKMENLLL